MSSSSFATSSELLAFWRVISWLSFSSIFADASSCTRRSPAFTIFPSGTSEMIEHRPCTSLLMVNCWLGAISPYSSTLMTSGPSCTVAYKAVPTASDDPPRLSIHMPPAATTAGIAILNRTLFFTLTLSPFAFYFLIFSGSSSTPSATRSASFQVPPTDTSRSPRSRWRASSWFL